ncbi:MBL fold metallo-hydrolase [Deinococcus sp.]|uniref:MBL fold metallo-hydrolase n=1 Tax=Deinococcus sp. TaxID=47478 RepID=UPI003CC5425A
MSLKVLTATAALMPGVPLNVHALVGERSSVLIDTGIAGMQREILSLCREAGTLRDVLLTHAHADHIGNNRAVQQATGARFSAGGALPWIEDLERHYTEFTRTDALPDSQEQRRDILELMDGPVEVDWLIGEGARLRLGGGVELETLAFPGHKLEEIGFLEEESGTLIVGDVLLARAAPFFHGFESARAFRASLAKLSALIEAGRARRVLSAHHPPLDATAALAEVRATRAVLDEIEEATLAEADGRSFAELWRGVSARCGKQAEFRGYAMLEAQVRELEQAGALTVQGEQIFSGSSGGM